MLSLNLVVSRVQELTVERGSSVVERRTRNRVSPGSNPPLAPFRRLGIFVLSIDAPVDSAVYEEGVKRSERSNGPDTARR